MCEDVCVCVCVVCVCARAHIVLSDAPACMPMCTHAAHAVLHQHTGALLSCRLLLKKAAGRHPKEISLQYIPCPQGYIPRVTASLSENAPVFGRGERWACLHHNGIVEVHCYVVTTGE